MKTLTMNDERILGVDVKMGRQDNSQAAPSWWKDFLREVKESLASPFESDWDRKCGLHWREWGKL